MLTKKPAALRSELGNYLMGNWDPNANTPSGIWQRDGARVRNRVVHSGHRPSRAEAEATMAAATGLERFICDRVAATAASHHRTASLLVGSPALERRSALTRKVVKLQATATNEPDWVDSYRDWRALVDHEIEDLL